MHKAVTLTTGRWYTIWVYDLDRGRRNQSAENPPRNGKEDVRAVVPHHQQDLEPVWILSERIC